jgi:hypothetical protein
VIEARTIEDDRLIERYVQSFCGFGSPEAPFWLLTAEPLDERTALDVRIGAWSELGLPHFVDADRYEDAVARLRGYRNGSVHGQSSLGALLRILLDALGEPCAPFDVAEYARMRAGRAGDRVALVQLFALPLQRSGRWDAHESSRLGALRSRSAFLDAFAKKRVALLQKQISSFAPRLVLMVGNVFGDYWKALSGASLRVVPEIPLRWRTQGNPATLFVQIAQPDVAGSLNATRSGAIAAFIRDWL